MSPLKDTGRRKDPMLMGRCVKEGVGGVQTPVQMGSRTDGRLLAGFSSPVQQMVRQMAAERFSPPPPGRSSHHVGSGNEHLTYNMWWNFLQ